jgi:hypothetical protein
MAKDTQGTDQPDNDLARQKAEAKAKAKAERLAKEYEYQRGEESTAWADINQQADNAVTAYKAKGRPPVHDWPNIQREILDRLANGQSLASICLNQHMPEPSTIYERLRKDPSFAQDYSQARGNLADLLFDQCLVIADDDSRDLVVASDGSVTVNNGAIARDKLKIETRMRMAGKMSGKYADRASLASDGANVTVNNLTVNARDMSPDARDRLRAVLLETRDALHGTTD